MRTILIPSLLLLAGCPQVTTVDDSENGGGGVPPRVQQIFTMYCATSAACHADGPIAPNLVDGATSESIKASGAGGQFVVFGDVGGSYLVEKMFPSPTAGGVMPPEGNPAPTPEEMSIIIGWVAGVEFPEGDTDTGTPMTDSGMDTMMMETGMDSSGGDAIRCSLEAMDPAADAAAAIDAGDGADQIPTAVADALLANCGCHYTDNVPEEFGADYTGSVPLGSIADFTADWSGTVPAGFSGPTHDAVSMRLDLAMPPATCVPDGTPASQNDAITQEHYDLLKDWLDAGAPDGANFP